MKLFFWKKNKPEPSTLLAKARLKSGQSEKLTPIAQKAIKDEIGHALDRRRYRVIPIKDWCEKRLTPVAWARVLIRVFPIMREFGYDFTEMQNPTESTRIKHDFYLVLRATMVEIYRKEYKAAEEV